MKEFYFTCPKYLVLLFLIYTLYVLANQHNVEIGVTEVIFCIALPISPVWLSAYFSRKVDKDLSGSLLNAFSLFSPAVVISIEVYFVYMLSLGVGGNGGGLLIAFLAGGFVFFVFLSTTMLLSVFAKSKQPSTDKAGIRNIESYKV